MATVQPVQSMADHNNDTLNDLQLWAKQQVLQIEALSNQQVLIELHKIMEGHDYSWHCINDFLQTRFEEGHLQFSFIDGDILFEWNNLCDEKRTWEKKRHLSVNNPEFNVDCLINLRILPIQAGLGIEEIQLVTSNMDKPYTSSVDLWAGPKDSQDIGRFAASGFLTSTDIMSSDSDGSDYVDDEEESDYEGLEHEYMLEFDDDDIDEHDLDEGQSEILDGGQPDAEESESSESVGSETGNENSGGLGVSIVDTVDDEISDLEL